MIITVNDIQRAILDGGDVSTFTEVYHRALGNPPVPSVASLEKPSALPETTVLLKAADSDFKNVVEAWADGKAYQLRSAGEVELTLVGLAPYGRNIGSYLERVIDEFRPGVIGIDTSPLGMTANTHYAFSLPCAVGIPAYGDILNKESGQFYASETLYPGNIAQATIVKSWLARIPVLAVGMSPRTGHQKSASYPKRKADVAGQLSRGGVLVVYSALDDRLSQASNIDDGIAIIRELCPDLMHTVGIKMREDLVEESRYIASRLMDIAVYAASTVQKPRILALVDVTHYLDTEYIIDLLKQGITDEVYIPSRNYTASTPLVMIGRYSRELIKQARLYLPEQTLSQKLFSNELDRFIETRDSEIVPEYDEDKLITTIVSRTRCHPEVVRGVSVRGTLAFKEILHGFADIHGGLTRGSISQAAMVALPHRIAAKPKSSEIAIVSDVV
ncbi:hypothetical protein ACFLW3_00830, partial [Chloroflexota bacterium]